MFEEEATKRLQELYEAGNTYADISASTGIAMSMIQRIVTKERPLKNLSVDTLLKIFPHARIDLEGNMNGNHIGNNSKVMIATNGNNSANFIYPDRTDEIIQGITSQVIASDEITAEAKISVLKIVENVAKAE